MVGVRKVVAIVCGGGPAPGINAVINAVTNTAARHGWDVLGMYDGFSHLGRGEKKLHSPRFVRRQSHSLDGRLYPAHVPL